MSPYASKKKAAKAAQRRRARKPAKLDPRAPAAPSWLSEDARARWPELLDLLGDGIATRQDSLAMAALCEAAAHYIRVREKIEAEGETYEMRNGTICAHPLTGKEQTYYREMIKLAKEFGLTPSSRASVEKIEADVAEKKSALGEMLAGDDD